jgi:fatty acid desaturase
LSVVVAGTLWLSCAPPPLWLAPLVSLVLGCSFAGLTFLGHEMLHGAIIRHRALRRIIGWLGFLPFAVSPRLWEAWHNRVHHGHTNRPGIDPDSYPSLAEYRDSSVVRAVTECAIGRSKLRGIFSLLIGFSVQSLHMLFEARRLKLLRPRDHAIALVETALGVGLWAALASSIGAQAFVFSFVLPLLVANSIVMSFILTNHNLSPQTSVNDPLVNSLSVTGPRFVEWLTLGFGFHVEHHLFPAMSARHAPGVRDALRTRFPERYQSLPWARALRALHRSGRVYDSPTTLIDPKTGRRWQTLLPQTTEAKPAPPPAIVPQPTLLRSA